VGFEEVSTGQSPSLPGVDFGERDPFAGIAATAEEVAAVETMMVDLIDEVGRLQREVRAGQIDQAAMIAAVLKRDAELGDDLVELLGTERAEILADELRELFRETQRGGGVKLDRAAFRDSALGEAFARVGQPP
jgi:hypothetical protein